MISLKKLLSATGAFIIIALSSVIVFAQESGEERTGRITFEELAQSFKQRQGENVSLDAFLDTPYDGCYGKQLTADSKVVYDALVSCIDKSKDGVSDLGIEEKTIKFEDGSSAVYDVVYIDGKTFDDADKDGGLDFVLYAIMAFDYDYPEVFWMDFNNIAFYYGESRKDGFWINIYLSEQCENYYCDGYSSKEQIDEDDKKIKEICADINEELKDMDTYNKLKYINSFLVDRNEYNRILLQTEDTKALDDRLWKAVSALIYGNTDLENPINPVCEGYARAFKILCNYENIECVLVSGDAHMWNYVKIPESGKWYGVDVTWNDPVFNYTPSEDDIEKDKYKYFLIGYKSMTEGGGENNLNKHKEERDSIYYDAIKGLNYPILENEDYVYIPVEEYIMGDIDKNGTVEMKDAADLLELVLEGGLTEYHKAVGNLDKSNGTITAADVSVLVQMVLDSQATGEIITE